MIKIEEILVKDKSDVNLEAGRRLLDSLDEVTIRKLASARLSGFKSLFYDVQITGEDIKKLAFSTIKTQLGNYIGNLMVAELKADFLDEEKNRGELKKFLEYYPNYVGSLNAMGIDVSGHDERVKKLKEKLEDSYKPIN